MKTQQTIVFNETEAAPSTIHINGKCNYREEGEMRVVFANGIPLFSYAKADKAADHYSMIHLVQSGLANQQEVASAFACSRLTILRSRKKFDQGGVAALIPKKTGPREGSKINGAKSRQIIVLKKKGLTNVAIASRLGLKEDAVRKALKRIGWSQPRAAEEMALPLEQGTSGSVFSQQSESEQGACETEQRDLSSLLPTAEVHESEEVSSGDEATASFDSDPSNRVIDRAFARLGPTLSR
jgi:transposase